MSRTSAETALQWLRAQLNDMGGFRNATTRDTLFKQWRQNTLTVIQRIWPGVTERSLRFKKVPFAPASNLADSRQVRESFERGCAEAGELLNHWIQEIEVKGVIELAAVQTQSSAEMTDYAETLTLDHTPSGEADGGDHEEVPTLDLSEAPRPSSTPMEPPRAGITLDLHDGPAKPPSPGHAPATHAAAAESHEAAPAATPGKKKGKAAGAKSKTRLKDMLGLSHLSAAQGAADHSSSTTPDAAPTQAPMRSAFSDPPPFLAPQAPPAAAIPPPPPEPAIPPPPPVVQATPFPAPPPMPAPPAEAPGFPVASSFPEPSSFPRATPGSEAPFPLPSNFPMGSATPTAETPPPAPIEAPEDLEDLQPPNERVFARTEIDLAHEETDTDTAHEVHEVHEVEEPQSYENVVEALEDQIQIEPITHAEHATLSPQAPLQAAPVAPPPAASMESHVLTPPPPMNSAFGAPAPIESEPPAPPVAKTPVVDPASMLQVISIDTPRTPPAPPDAMIMTDEINPSRFSGRTAVVAALAAQLDHMDIPPIDRIALKRFLIDLALRLESNTCAWVDLRAAVITVMEYPQLARRALPALLPFLDRAA